VFAKVDLFVRKVSLLPVNRFVCVTLRGSLEIVWRLLDRLFRVDKGFLGGFAVEVILIVIAALEELCLVQGMCTWTFSYKKPTITMMGSIVVSGVM